jgi:hypothetical protein
MDDARAATQSDCFVQSSPQIAFTIWRDRNGTHTVYGNGVALRLAGILIHLTRHVMEVVWSHKKPWTLKMDAVCSF